MPKPHYLRKKRKSKGPARPHGVKTKRRKKPTLADLRGTEHEARKKHESKHEARDAPVVPK